VINSPTVKSSRPDLVFKVIFKDDAFRPFLSIFGSINHPSDQLRPHLGHFYRFECEKLQILKKKGQNQV
jgi:hypothetical protein